MMIPEAQPSSLSWGRLRCLSFRVTGKSIDSRHSVSQPVVLSFCVGVWIVDVIRTVNRNKNRGCRVLLSSVVFRRTVVDRRDDSVQV
jgi:hypothetical protein